MKLLTTLKLSYGWPVLKEISQESIWLQGFKRLQEGERGQRIEKDAYSTVNELQVIIVDKGYVTFRRLLNHPDYRRICNGVT
jgi:hypothetical protein